MQPSTNQLAPDPNSAADHFKPELMDLLRALGLDVVYHRALGNYLYTKDAAGAELAVLDFVGGYGSTLLGHFHPALVAEAQRLLAAGCPIHAQGSIRPAAMTLAAELARRVGGDYLALFGNSGAEAVEVAMKHALLETGGRTFIALSGAFHGKTLGALQLTANENYREGMSIRGVPIVRIQPNNLAQLHAAFTTTRCLAGFIYEPIQGEGGVRSLTAEFLQAAAKSCAERNVPLIADECQTGLGRTGEFLASSQLGVAPDYVLLSKSLGGGLAKISAVLIQRRRYCSSFELKHSSTFADDDFSCGVALATLGQLNDQVLADCASKGNRLRAGLERLRERYPEIISEVRGRGLMLGLELRPLLDSSSFLLRMLSARQDLAFLVMGHMLRRHQIRVATTLSDRFTLRLEPSAFITDTEMDRFCAALEEVCQRLHEGDAASLTSHLSASSPPVWSTASADHEGEIITCDGKPLERLPDPATASSVAWLCHLIDANDLIHLDANFQKVSMAQRENFLARAIRRAQPVIMARTDLRSKLGSTARLYPILLPFTSRWVKDGLDGGKPEMARGLVQEGIDLAAKLGCGLVALGQYTSIVSQNGLGVDSRGLGLTTGNSYAVALALEAIERVRLERGLESGDATLVVVGASGNIGRSCAELMAPHYRNTVLIGSNRRGSIVRLEALAKKLPRATAATNLAAARDGHVVMVATNAVDAPLRAEHLRPSALVCDLSVPATLSRDVAQARPDICLIRGGIAHLPGGEDLGIVGFPLERGQTYGCMAEGLLLSWEGRRDREFTGSLSSAHITEISALAARHGMTLADCKSSCVVGSDWKEIDGVYVGS